MKDANGLPNTERKPAPLDRPDVVRTVPAGTAIRIGNSTVLALPYAGAVRYLVWSPLDVHLAKLDGIATMRADE